MNRLGIPFVAVKPEVDEEQYKQLNLPAEQLVLKLSEAKARSVRDCPAGALIVGSDQCAEMDGQVLGKPGDFAQAVQQLSLLAGRTHRLLTAVCVLDTTGGRSDLHLDIHQMTMRCLDESQIEQYVERDRPFDCAGAYRIESLGIALFERVEGRDYTAIVGLPMMRLSMMLAERGVDVLTSGAAQRAR